MIKRFLDYLRKIIDSVFGDELPKPEDSKKEIKEEIKQVEEKTTPVIEPQKTEPEKIIKVKKVEYKSKEEELKTNLVYAEEQGFDKWIPYVQAVHETGYFKKIIGDYNYWGIKKPKTWEGKVHRLWTHEAQRKPYDMNRVAKKYGVPSYEITVVEDHGDWVKLRIPQFFIDFESGKQAVMFWISLIRTLSVYNASWQRRHDYKKFYKFLTAWATDPNYAKKLITLYRSLKEKGKLT